MKITIDVEGKVIKLNGSILLGELFRWLKNNIISWEEYKIVSENTIEYYPSSPNICPQITPDNPYQYPQITCYNEQIT